MYGKKEIIFFLPLYLLPRYKTIITFTDSLFCFRFLKTKKKTTLSLSIYRTTEMAKFGEIWNSNKEEEISLMSDCLKSSSYIAIDTEFPGCLKETTIKASEEDRYRDLKFNVDRTKLIQLGLTLFDEGGRICGTWEVNFSDFDVTKDASNEKSIAFLRRNGLNFEKIRAQGIPIEEFFKQFSQILNMKKLTWVNFDGSYDMGYLVKGLTGGESLPETSKGFKEVVERLVVGDVFDVKEMSGLCKGLSSRYGLQRVADEFQIKRVRKAHHAGSDSELTARVYIKMALMLYHDYKRKRFETDKQQQHIQERMIHQDYKRMRRLRADQQRQHLQGIMIHENYNIMHLRAAQQQHLQELLMARGYVPPSRMFPAFHPFGGHFPRLNYV